VSPSQRADPPNRLLDLIPRLRWLFFALAAVILLAAFNGKWRIGRDSAAYRGLGHQLATTGKYHFRDKQGQTRYIDQQDTRYPGLPILLAGVEKLFGRSDFAAVSLVFLIGLVTVVLTYRLARPALPLWLAVAVTFGLGVNARFLRHAHAVLTDVPFLMGVVLTLLAFDRLVRTRSAKGRITGMILLVLGLLFSASMRPTFWVLALALVVTCLWGLFARTHREQGPEDARPRRLACAMTLALLAIATAIFVLAVDLRGKSISEGGYEAKVLSRLANFQHRILAALPANTHEMLEQTVPESFFGTQFGGGFIPVGGGRHVGFSTLASLLLLASAAWLARVNVLWGVFTIGSVITMCCLGSVPRYFVMILPFLLTGWGLFVAAISRKAAVWGLAELVTMAGLGVVVVTNLLMSADFIREQWGYTRSAKYVGFERAYASGDWSNARPVAEMIRNAVSPDQKVIGPEATVLTYLSDRDVYALGKFLPKRDKASWVPRIRKLDFKYAVFPDGRAELYNDKDKITARLIKAGVLRPTKVIARAAGYKLCEFQVVEAKKLRRERKLAATQPAATKPAVARKSKKNRAAQVAPGTQPAATQPGRKKKRRPTTQAVTTAPANRAIAASGPAAATQPARRKKRRPATAPTTQAAAAAATAPAGSRRSRRSRSPATGPATLPGVPAPPAPASPGAFLHMPLWGERPLFKSAVGATLDAAT
jgi:4-amino-4-deoxy-L-arabinose transferase-like glycosyltransferase